MLSTEITNIPISISILHEREYNNLSLIYKLYNKSDKTNKRRAFSEKSAINTMNTINNEKINNIYGHSITPKSGYLKN